MEIFLDQAITFLALSGGVLATLLGYMFYKSDWNVDKFKENWIKSEGTKTPMWKAIIVILLVPVLMAAVLYTANAKADEIKWFDGATVFTGLDYTANQSPLCQPTGVNDRLTSNIGFTQNIVAQGPMRVSAKYTHHSCAISADMNSYDAIGIVIEWKIW